MKSVLLFVLVVFNFTMTFSQETKKEVVEIKEGWTNKGHIVFLFNQFAFSRWSTGGENNVAGNLGLDYDFNYVKKNKTWDTKALISYGLTKSKTNEFPKKTDDRFEFNSVIGVRASKKWYYSAFVNFKTQFTTGYIYKKDDNDKEIRLEHTNFMSPGELAFGPGMRWKKAIISNLI